MGPGRDPGPNYKADFRLSKLQIRIIIDVVFDVDFVSFWRRSWVPLGGTFVRLFRPKLVPEPSSHRLTMEKVSCHEMISNIFDQD